MQRLDTFSLCLPNPISYVMLLKLIQLFPQSKLAESEDKVAAMAVQLEQLHADRLRLENRNSVLEKVILSAFFFYAYVLSGEFSLHDFQLNCKTHLQMHYHLHPVDSALYRCWR